MGRMIFSVWHHDIVQNLCGQYVNSVLPGWVTHWVDYLYAQLLGFQCSGILKITNPPPRSEKYTREKFFEILGIYLRFDLMGECWEEINWSSYAIQVYAYSKPGLWPPPSVLSNMTVFIMRRVALDMLEAVSWRFITCWRERLEDKVSFSAPQHPNAEVNTPVTRYPSQNWSHFELLRRAEALWEVP